MIGVEVTYSPTKKRSGGGKRWVITPKKEVILSAGAIATPQLLLLSGVGPRKDLEEHGIEPVLENENVGKNLVDVSTLRFGLDA